MTSTHPTDSVPAGADDALCAQLESVRSILAGLPEQLVGVSSQALASLAASAAGVVSAAEAARAAVVLEAHARGVINASDHPRTRDWVEASCAQAGVPVTKALARQLHDIATGIDGHDLAALRAAVTAGEVPMESAALVAKVFRRLKKKTDYDNSSMHSSCGRPSTATSATSPPSKTGACPSTAQKKHSRRSTPPSTSCAS